MGDTQYKGDVGLAMAIAYFIQNRNYVSLPTTESAPYDCIVDDETGLHKVQTKYSKSGSVDLRCIHSNSTGYVVKKYADFAFDWLFVYKPTGEMYLIKRNLNGRSYVTPKTYEQIYMEVQADLATAPLLKSDEASDSPWAFDSTLPPL